MLTSLCSPIHLYFIEFILVPCFCYDTTITNNKQRAGPTRKQTRSARRSPLSTFPPKLLLTRRSNNTFSPIRHQNDQLTDFDDIDNLLFDKLIFGDCDYCRGNTIPLASVSITLQLRQHKGDAVAVQWQCGCWGCAGKTVLRSAGRGRRPSHTRSIDR